MEGKTFQNSGRAQETRKPKFFQGTKTGNLVGVGVLVENSNTFYLQIKEVFGAGKEKF